jgi:thymidylate kinase/predicted nucleotidyltransferase
MTPPLIYLAGVDGSGKTTHARLLLNALAAGGMRGSYVWLRFPRLTSIPFLAYARLRGYSWREVVDGVEHGYWDFRRSWLMSVIFPWALWLDTFLMATRKLYLPLMLGRSVVCDRFVADILVDLMLALNDPDFFCRAPGKLFLALLPSKAQVVVLDIETDLARQRSPDLRGDRTHAQRRQAYLRLAERLGWPVVNNAQPLENVSTELREKLIRQEKGDLHEPDQHDISVYAKVKSPWMQRLVHRKEGALAVHWLFQGLLYMDPTERRIKLGIDLLLSLLFGSLLKRRLRIVPAFGLGLIAAHTLNFIFNGQIFGVLKHFGGVRHTWDEFNGEVERMRRKAAEEPDIVYAAAFGSLARSEWSPTSDLDVRLVRAPGLRSALRVGWFAIRERARANFIRFPLDLYVLDRYESLERMSEKEPVYLAGSENGTVQDRYDSNMGSRKPGRLQRSVGEGRERSQ